MRLGFMTNILVKKGMVHLDEIAEWAAAQGFEDLEVGPTVPMERELFERVLEKGKVAITSLTYCRNFLSTDSGEAEAHIAELKKRIAFAGDLGIEKIVTSTGINTTLEEGIYDKADSIRRTPARSLNQFVETFAPIVEYAEKKNVKLAFENCPLMGNIAISPVMWREILKRLDSKMVGLAYDPSHLVWQFIDPYAPVAEFGDRIFHVHAKDTEIKEERLKECGILTDFSWWSYRIPGHGLLDWRKLTGELEKAGYQGTVSIEHEDPDYEDSLELVENGLILGKEYLKAFIGKR